MDSDPIIINALLGLGVTVLGAAIIGFFRMALDAFKEQKAGLAALHDCIDTRLKKIDETLVRLDTWREGHEKADERRTADLNQNLQNLREGLQNVLGRV